ncbi:MAG: UvrD-helicase domain-containing protein [Treponema sp.]|nr:UvrD-helicase domain-containing protein [Treponema sp.]
MSWYFIGAGIASISVIIGIILIFKKVSKKHFQELAEQSKEYFPKIDDFFSELKNLSSNYISKTDESVFSQKWAEFYADVQQKRFPSKLPDYDKIAYFLKTYSNLHTEILNRNDVFLQKEMQENDSLLSNIDGKSLDEQQRRVVVSDEDRTLVLAGAGSGKTLTIAAKVKYLCEVKHVAPEDILLISFTNKSAAEMTERIQKKLGIPVEATTFHKLGLDIITKNLGYRPEVTDDLTNFVHGFFETELFNHPDLVQSLTEYFTYYLEIPETMEECDNLGDLYEREKSADLETLKSKYEREQYIKKTGSENAKNLTTLNGEQVKSIEETKIANFLFMHGVKYEYERLYPFESEDVNRKAYRPDFYLTDFDIYLEHFGISKDYKCPWLSEVEEQKYLDGIKWKREFHQQNQTKLIETYSYYTKEGRLLPELEKLLLANGVIFSEHDFNDIFETIYAKKSNKYFSEFIKLCCTFITLFKSNNYKVEQFEQMKNEALLLKNDFLYQRTCIFLDIAKIILNEYQKYLSANKSIDFSDMINDAATKVEAGASIPKYQYVIVDEYQDISHSRFNLLKSIVTAANAKLLCVGDDWQSIYRFAGSDISLFTDFEKYLGYTNLLKIEKTYRNSQQLIDEASRFVIRNPLQLRKQLLSGKELNYPLVFWGYDKEPYPALSQVMQKIISEFGPDKSILLLGRTNFDIEILKASGLFSVTWENRVEKLTYLPSPQTPVSFLSVHKSKGLEADNVVLVNFKNDKLGFPNQIADDKVLNYVLTQGENYMFAEERRLFYVAITRTKNRTFVMTDNRAPSIFFREFSESQSCCFVHIKKVNDETKTHCPRCQTGELLKVEHEGKRFIGCSNYPKCRYTLNNISILSSPKQCPSCGGFLVKRKGARGHWFVGCTNYPYCEHTEQLERV